MQLTLLRNDTMVRLPLPAKVNGQYWVSCTDGDGCESQLISVEGVGSSWVLKSNKRAWVLDGEKQRVRELVLQTNQFYEVVVDSTKERILLHCEPSTDDRKKYAKYAVPRNARLRIGRADDCDIRFESNFVSANHADIVFNGDSISIADTQSANGTFVNSRRVTTTELQPGDVISLFGLAIVVGRAFLAINNPDGLVTLNSALLEPLPPQVPRSTGQDREVEEGQCGVVFYRSPRFKRDIATAEITIDPPPQLNDREDMPLVMVLGPALTMGIASLFMGIFAVFNVVSTGGRIAQALPTLIMSVSMMVGMILWPILARRYERLQKAAREAKRQTKYRAYIDEMSAKIQEEQRSQSEILFENVVTVDDCLQRIRARERGLWERTTSHNDFLLVRLGVGTGVFDAQIKHAQRKFTLDDDDLQDIMLAVAEEPNTLDDVPVGLSLVEHPILGVIGDRPKARELVGGIVTQLVALHGYDELKLIFIVDPAEAEDWEFARWLPHSWSDDRASRFVATNPEDLRRLAAVLEPELALREEMRQDEDPADMTPHYVVFALDKELAGKSDLIARILGQKTPLGFYVVALYDELHKLPRECRAVIEVGAEGTRLYDKQDTTGAFRALQSDIGVSEDARQLAVRLANTHLDTMTSAFVLPGTLSFLELHGVGKVEHLNPLARWRESNPVVSLEAAVGVGANGEHLLLDVHEKRHGPHGLIAGMTGSGKSEFIMTYILSLAVNYDPQEVAFVLIDYKGGGMANALGGLPHVAGTVTNLDGAAINRSLVSIQSELKRRQAIFNEAGVTTEMSNVDIYKYQSLYRDGVVSEPLPHLLIVSDEFAELKSQQPEFMSQLVSAARIGRSLGVHLILATQKPSGVVDDQIWSNSRFRVCLKVQEKADSMEVIKRPDAAALQATGRFYMQVGFDELFEMGQSAWAGAPYYPADRVEKAFDDSVVLIDDIGQPLRQARLDRRRGLRRNPPKQLDEIVKHLVEVAAGEGMRTRPLWLEPIPADIYWDELCAKYGLKAQQGAVLAPLVGEFDDPTNQRQEPLVVPLTEAGHVLVYGAAGSGKTDFVTTLVYSILQQHDPTQAHIYLLDFEAETLRAFQKAPHVGDVLCSHDEEKIENLFKMLRDEIARRKSLFAESGGDFASHVQQDGQHLESIVVVIHNYTSFVESYDDKEEAVASLSREGSRYGIYMVLTTAGTSSIGFRLLQNFKQLFVLQLNDASDYTNVFGSTEGVQPSPIHGRGIFKTGTCYEFQTARPSRAAQNETVFIKETCARLAEEWTGPTARRVPILPERVTVSALLDDAACPDLKAVPIGIDARTLEVADFDFRKRLVTLVLSQSGESDGFISGLADALAQKCEKRTIVLDPGQLLTLSGSPRLVRVQHPSAVSEAVVGLFDELVARHNRVADARAAGEPIPVDDDLICVVPALTGLLDSLAADVRDKFMAILLKCDASTRAIFILADSEGAAAVLVRLPWLKPHVSGADGIWIGDGFAVQYTLQPAKTSGAFYEEIGAQFGYLLAKGKPRLVKLLTAGEDVVSGDSYE